MVAKTRQKAEFGDFQTPDMLAREATQLLKSLGIEANAIIEPTCGQGAFLQASINCFPKATATGFDINADHLGVARARLPLSATLRLTDFFKTQWENEIQKLADPILIIGNPPWVTSSLLGTLSSSNLPQKSNFNRHRGIDAITGKSNFDISEWMLLQYLDWLEGRHGTIAVLCKTIVARKILAAAWRRDYPIAKARLYQFDAVEHFGASVDACFLVLTVGRRGAKECDVFPSLSSPTPSRAIGYSDGILATDINKFGRWAHLFARQPETQVWRSGIKHDCSSVMEIYFNGSWCNGLKERVDIEDTYLYPLLKSSDIGNGRTRIWRAMIVPQRRVGEDTGRIEHIAPRTWAYLVSHASQLDSRGSSIYSKKGRFAIFGVGDYSFSPWKVAISGLYKRLAFTKLGSVDGKPIVLDDTINFLSFQSERYASLVHEFLSSNPAREFLESMVSWTDKRPVTTEILRRLSLRRLATELGRADEYATLQQAEDLRTLPLYKVA